MVDRFQNFVDLGQNFSCAEAREEGASFANREEDLSSDDRGEFESFRRLYLQSGFRAFDHVDGDQNCVLFIVVEVVVVVVELVVDVVRVLKEPSRTIAEFGIPKMRILITSLLFGQTESRSEPSD